MFPRPEVFSHVPFHVAHTVLEKGQEHLDFQYQEIAKLCQGEILLSLRKPALAGRSSADTEILG